MFVNRQEKHDAKAELSLFEKRREFLNDELKILRAVKEFTTLDAENQEWLNHIEQELPENEAQIKILREKLGILEMTTATDDHVESLKNKYLVISGVVLLMIVVPIILHQVQALYDQFN